MSTNDGYYKTKTKLKKFHLSLLVCFILFLILVMLAYFRFIILYKITFYVMFLCMFYSFYQCFFLHRHVMDTMKKKKEKGIKPAFDIDIVDD